MRVITIYGLHNGDNTIRYVGKTVGVPSARLGQHRTDARRDSKLPVHRWMRKHGIDNIKTTVLEEIEFGDDAWKSIEATWIEALMPARLLNILKGGEGAHEPQFSEEHRRKIGEALKKGRFRQCESCGQPRWVIPSQEERGAGRFCSRICRGVWDKARKYPSIPVNPRAVEAAAVARRSRTHCKRGHLLSGENMRMEKNRRVCRTCVRQRVAAKRASKKIVT